MGRNDDNGSAKSPPIMPFRLYVPRSTAYTPAEDAEIILRIFRASALETPLETSVQLRTATPVFWLFNVPGDFWSTYMRTSEVQYELVDGAGTVIERGVHPVNTGGYPDGMYESIEYNYETM